MAFAHTPSETELAEAIYRAAGAAFRELFDTHPDEHFYYCTLTTTGSAQWVTAAAWSFEAMARDLLEDGVGEHDTDGLIWDDADSPYSMLGEEQFAAVTELFARRPPMDEEDDQAWDEEWALRLSAMERAMARLDDDGLFERAEGRLQTLVAVEVMPPDFTNGERIDRLNPPEVVRWARRMGWSDE